jgi:hypothetical protein
MMTGGRDTVEKLADQVWEQANSVVNSYECNPAHGGDPSILELAKATKLLAEAVNKICGRIEVVNHLRKKYP